MNLPNKLTVSRLALTGLFLAALFGRFPGSATAALLLFSAAGFTDYLDGRIARSRGLVTDFGTLMDPLADKILTCSAFIAFVELRRIEGWMVVVIVGRELAITGLRLLAASKSVVLAAERFGKHKTASQILAVLATLILMAHVEWGGFGRELLGDGAWIQRMVAATQWLAVVLTIYSGAAYLRRNRALYLDDL